MRIVLLGAGHVGGHLAQALHQAGHTIVQVYSRQMKHAEDLAHIVGAQAVTDLSEITPSAEVYFFTVPDAVIVPLATALAQCFIPSMCIHTAACVPVSDIAPFATQVGVLYPLQTFTKGVPMDWHSVPCMIEGGSDKALACVRSLAMSISTRVLPTNEAQRLQWHIAAVFACNFTNHCYAVAQQLAQRADLPFDLLLPLIQQTADKVQSCSPILAQTGPAVRHDEETLSRHRNILQDNRPLIELYDMLTKHIQTFAHLTNHTFTA